MLLKMYGMIWEIENELKVWNVSAPSQQDSNESSDLQWLKSWVKRLYGLERKGGVYVVGPMGERPMHVCGFAIAKYRGMNQIHIADGILDGMMNFVKKTELNKSSALCEPYGKDYCAAVGCQLRKEFDVMGEKSFSFSQFLQKCGHCNDLPYVKQIYKWLKRHFSTQIIDMGMYEDETVHFALIACGDSRGVKWFVEEDKKRGEEGYTYSDRDKPWTSIR
jgi:hypothetical protein